jgi:hypothetical protein
MSAEYVKSISKKDNLVKNITIHRRLVPGDLTRTSLVWAWVINPLYGTGDHQCPVSINLLSNNKLMQKLGFIQKNTHDLLPAVHGLLLIGVMTKLRNNLKVPLNNAKATLGVILASRSSFKMQTVISRGISITFTKRY